MVSPWLKHKMVKKIIYIIVILLCIPIALAWFPRSPPPGLVPGQFCGVTGCTMQGDINMSGYTIFNATFLNSTFVGDTTAIGNINMNNYNITNIDYVEASFFCDNSNNCYLISDFLINTQKQGDENYLYNDSTTIYFNDTKINNTITNKINLLVDLDTIIRTNNVSWIIKNQAYWNNTNVVFNIIESNDWSNITLYESQILDLTHTIDTNTQKTTLGFYLYNDSTTIYFNESKFNQSTGLYINDTFNLSYVAYVNKENLFIVDQYINEDIRLNFRNFSQDTYFFYNVSNQTLQLVVNGEIQQDWGASTTVYGKATFLGNALFNNISGNAMVIDTNLLVTGNATFQDLIYGNGSQITDVCLTNGTGCTFNATEIFNLTGLDTNTQRSGEGYLYNDSTYIYLNETLLNNTIDDRDNDIDTRVVGDNIYLYNDTTTMYFNETKLNETITQLTGIFEENITITVSGGTGTGNTVECCTGANEILQVAVFPTTPTNLYRFNATTTIGGEVLDRHRLPWRHQGDWAVAHRGSVVINDTITYNLYDVSIDENIVVRVRYKK